MAVDYPESLPDLQVLLIAHQEQRILVTEERDFGELVFRHHLPHSGVIYLRLKPMELVAKIARLSEILEHHGDSLDRFIVVTSRAVRIRQKETEP